MLLPDRFWQIARGPLDENAKLEISAYLCKATTVDAFIERIASLLMSIGVADFAHVCLNHISGTLDPFGTYAPSWTDGFQREGFHLADIATRHLMIERVPVFRSIVSEWVDRAPFQKDPHITLHRDASRYLAERGLFDVYNIPIVQEDYLAAFSVSVPECAPNQFQKLIETHEPFIHFLAEVVDYVGRNRFKRHFHNDKKNPRVPISLKTITIIQTMADKRCRPAEASVINGVTPNYGNKLLYHARKVLGSDTIKDLILDAANARLINLER